LGFSRSQERYSPSGVTKVSGDSHLSPVVSLLLKHF
jgi:hypothetical protein